MKERFAVRKMGVGHPAIERDEMRIHKVTRVIFVIFALFAMATLCVFACACSRAYTCPYDWDGLQSNGDRLEYYEKGVLQSRTGIDVSEYQGLINWRSVALDGIEFAYVRIGNRGTTEGTLYADAYYDYNVSGARAAGLMTGVYFFSQAVNEEEAIEEADFVLSLLGGRYLELPVVYDWEVTSGDTMRSCSASEEDAARAAQAFCDRIEAGGYSAMVYGSTFDFGRMGTDIKDVPLWLAEYGVSHPDAEFDYSMWQYTASGTVAGINTDVDMNIWFLTARVPIE